MKRFSSFSRTRFSALLALFCFSACFFTGCGKEEFSLPEDLAPCDREKAMAYAEKCVSFGERPSGSKALFSCGNWIMETLRKIPEAKVSSRTFTESTPAGPVAFRNILCRIPGESPDYVIVSAHYDTKKFSSFSFVGANDGASGVSALLLLAETLSRCGKKLPYTLLLVFFDGEECQEEYGPGDGLHGSRHFAANLHEQKGRCRAMILLDMVGDKDLFLTVPTNTHPVLRALLERSAAYRKKSAVAGSFPGGILDDHVPFQKKGIPAIDLIDFSYGENNVFWHTPEDTLDKISGESMALAADLVLGMLFNMKKYGL